MKRFMVITTALLLMLASDGIVTAQESNARVRVVHASPDAPAVDVLVNDSVAFSNVAFKEITDYAELSTATYNIKVVPTGATEPVVIEADLTLNAGQDYTVVAVGKLSDIEPVVLEDNNGIPAAGRTHIRFVHASPDAPSVDVKVKDGPVLFEEVFFKNGTEYLPVDAGTYDLQALVSETGAVALEIPAVKLNDKTVYTIFAMGLVGGDPALQIVPSVDATTAVTLPATGTSSPTLLYTLTVVGLGVALVGGGLAVRRRSVQT